MNNYKTHLIITYTQASSFRVSIVHEDSEDEAPLVESLPKLHVHPNADADLAPEQETPKTAAKAVAGLSPLAPLSPIQASAGVHNWSVQSPGGGYQLTPSPHAGYTGKATTQYSSAGHKGHSPLENALASVMTTVTNNGHLQKNAHSHPDAYKSKPYDSPASFYPVAFYGPGDVPGDHSPTHGVSPFNR